MRISMDGQIDSGQTLVEFALVLPISLMTILAIAIFGLGLARLEAVENAASEGARAAQRWVPGGPETCVQAVHNAVDRATPFPTSVVIKPVPSPCPADATTRVATGTFITVEVTYTYRPLFISTLFRDAGEDMREWPLRAEATVMHE